MLKHILSLVSLSIFFALFSQGVARAAGLGEDCTNAECVSEGNPPQYGLYCKELNGGPNSTKTCAACSVKPNGATFIGDSNSGDNCPWKMECPNEPITCHSGRSTENCGTHKPDQPNATGYGADSTCTYNDPENITCSANYYRDGNECKSCASETSGHYQMSAEGSVGINSCYKTCQRTTISHGYLTPTNNKAYYDPQQPNNSDTCVYTTECDNPTDKCNGYHPEGQRCEYNVKNDTGCYQLYYSDTGWSEGCYRTQNYCSQQRQGFYGQECNNRYGQCYDETLPCADNSTITGRCDGGSVSGNIQQSEWQQFNYSGCECTKTDQPLYSGNTPIGTATMVYGYNRNGTINQTPSTVTVQTCIAGYYANSNTCTITQQDYYSGAGEIAQHKCPYGSKTTGTGSTSVNACSYPANTTFKDKSGNTTRSFTLGVDAQLSTAVKQSQ